MLSISLYLNHYLNTPITLGSTTHYPISHEILFTLPYSHSLLLLEKQPISAEHFIEIIKVLHQLPSQPFNPPKFIFKWNPDAASYNANLLVEANFDLDQIIHQQHPSQISYGSEFWPAHQLEELLSHHPFWHRLKEILTKGAIFSMEEIEESKWMKDLTFHTNRGNHKSAKTFEKILQELRLCSTSPSDCLTLPT